MINKLEKIKKSNDETEIKNNKKNEQIKKINQEIEIKIKNSKYRAKLLKIQNTVKLQESKPKNKLEELLILKEQECKLHNLKCYEYPNLEVLDKLVNSYNNSFHRSIKTIPINVNKTNEKKNF